MEALFLVLGRTPATKDEEFEAVVRSISCRLAQGAEESCIKVGYTRHRVIKDRRAVEGGAVSLATRIMALTAGDVNG